MLMYVGAPVICSSLPVHQKLFDCGLITSEECDKPETCLPSDLVAMLRVKPPVVMRKAVKIMKLHRFGEESRFLKGGLIEPHARLHI